MERESANFKSRLLTSFSRHLGLWPPLRISACATSGPDPHIVDNLTPKVITRRLKRLRNSYVVYNHSELYNFEFIKNVIRLTKMENDFFSVASVCFLPQQFVRFFSVWLSLDKLGLLPSASSCLFFSGLYGRRKDGNCTLIQDFVSHDSSCLATRLFLLRYKGTLRCCYCLFHRIAQQRKVAFNVFSCLRLAFLSNCWWMTKIVFVFRFKYEPLSDD